MLYTHPKIFLWMVEQDRERAMAQRALERAARSGGEQRPGAARGGFSSFARVLRTSVAAALRARPNRGGRTVGGTRPSEA
jgi:hypothetical protein